MYQIDQRGERHDCRLRDPFPPPRKERRKNGENQTQKATVRKHEGEKRSRGIADDEDANDTLLPQKEQG